MKAFSDLFIVCHSGEKMRGVSAPFDMKDIYCSTEAGILWKEAKSLHGQIILSEMIQIDFSVQKLSNWNRNTI